MKLDDWTTLLAAGLVAAFVTTWGTGHLVLAWREREPLEITCADYIAKRPTERWLRLTHCAADADHLGVLVKKGGGSSTISKVYVPLRPEDTNANAHLVVARDDDAIRAIAGHRESTQASAATEARVAASLAEPTEGLVRDAASAERTDLPEHVNGLADDFVVIERGDHPTIGFAILATVVGLIGLIVTTGMVIARRKKPRVPMASLRRGAERREP